MKRAILNTGGNSFKFRVLDKKDETVLAQGRVERVGHAGIECADFPAAVRKCICQIVGSGRVLANPAEIEAVGFKAVHIGPLNERQLIGDEFLAIISANEETIVARETGRRLAFSTRGAKSVGHAK